MDLFREILSGNKVALSKGITLLESSLDTDNKIAKIFYKNVYHKAEIL